MEDASSALSDNCIENNNVFSGDNLTEKEFTLNFISIYRDMPMLWKIKSKEYMDKNKRNAAIKKMTNLLRMCRRNITEDDVKKKIYILRTSFRRENNKIKKSMLSGSGTENVYVPTLWYFKELEFLQDQMEEESGISTIEHQEFSTSIQSSSTSSQNLEHLLPKNPPKKKKEDLQHDLLKLARDHFKKPENEYLVMAKNWAFKLERMSAEQRRLAEKFINEILFEGEEGNLHRNAVIINPSRISHSPYSITQTPSPYSHTVSPSPQTQPHDYIQSPVLHVISTEQMPDAELPVLHIPNPPQTNDSTEADIQSPIIQTILTEQMSGPDESTTAATYLEHFTQF